MPVSKRLRYEILRRDNHACRYCGATAPAATLTVDHVTPVTLGGNDEPANLVAACVDCNAGKSASAPDAAMVADVAADAMRWRRALREAASQLRYEYADRNEHRQLFRQHWQDWKYGTGSFAKTMPLPDDWESSVDNFIAAGLPLEVLFECIDKAMARKGTQDVFRYMCGIAWRKVTEIREIASALLAADEET